MHGRFKIMRQGQILNRGDHAEPGVVVLTRDNLAFGAVDQHDTADECSVNDERTAGIGQDA